MRYKAGSYCLKVELWGSPLGMQMVQKRFGSKQRLVLHRGVQVLIGLHAGCGSVRSHGENLQQQK